MPQWLDGPHTHLGWVRPEVTPPKYKAFSFAIYNHRFSLQSLPQLHLLLPCLRNFVNATGLECTVVAHVLNEPESIERLYADHHSWLQGWLRGRLGNAFDAADLAQDTFVRVLLRRPLPPLREPRSYLSTIARGLVVDHWRRRELEQAWLQTLSVLPEADIPSPESQLLVLEALVEIDRVLDSLKPAVRSAFMLAQLEGLSCPEIAKRLGVSLATVERHIAKALRACYAMRFEA